MKQLDLVILNHTGLHARPAKALVNLAKTFESKITVSYGKRKINAKSMISVLTLGVPEAGEISIVIDGADEDAAAVAIEEAVNTGLGEPIPSSNGHSDEQTTDSPTEATTPVVEAVAPAEETEPSTILKGVAASTGIAIGPIQQWQHNEVELGDHKKGDVATELSAFQRACEQAKNAITDLHAQMIATIGAESADIFMAHLAILNDVDLVEETHSAVKEGASAAEAWRDAYTARANALAQLDDPNLAARSADIKDVGGRVLHHLLNVDNSHISLWPDHPIILLADDLTPSDTASLDRSRVLAICTAQGGPNAHTAILARALGLPAVVGVGEHLLALANGTTIIVDGAAGTVDTQPSPEAIDSAKNHQAELAAVREAASANAHEHAVTTDGKRIEIVANVGGVAEAERAFEAGAEGVGLLRTEFLFLERDTPPTEDEQTEVYRGALKALQGQPVLMRTLDVGGDKQLPYLDLPEEQNPFLGERGIRLCLNRPDIFRTQLRALMRAADSGPLRIMFPMISALSEFRAAKKLVEEVQAELNAPSVELGIMIEVPAAALLAHKFAPEVDFFSVGTNDLTQYTTAIDRMHPLLAGQADGLNPAVLSLIKMTVQAADAEGKWVGVCGELGADPQALPILIGLGVSELSVSVPAIPLVKSQVRTLEFAAVQKLAERALQCESAEQVRALS